MGQASLSEFINVALQIAKNDVGASPITAIRRSTNDSRHEHRRLVEASAMGGTAADRVRPHHRFESRSGRLQEAKSA
jgi:hypothetical protein